MLYNFSEAWQLGFQDPCSPIMESAINFHNYVMIYLVFIIGGVLWILTAINTRFSKSKTVISHKHAVHGQLIETIWTITPAIILLSIAFPSFKLLFLMDEVIKPDVTIKVIGHQWYWTYEYGDYYATDGSPITFDAYMVPEENLEVGQLRNLTTTAPLTVPVNAHVRVIVTSADVIHSWAVPSFGVKVDAIPGRLNETSFLAERTGTYFGQCSEICGLQHAFMPIEVEVVEIENYASHIEMLLNEIEEDLE